MQKHDDEGRSTHTNDVGKGAFHKRSEGVPFERSERPEDSFATFALGERFEELDGRLDGRRNVVADHPGGM